MRAKLISELGVSSDASADELRKFVRFSHGVYSAPLFSVFGMITESRAISAIRRELKETERFLSDADECANLYEPTEGEMN